jgi:hypothetical protein
VATEALTFILERLEAARDGRARFVQEIGSACNERLRFRTEVADEAGARPDLIGHTLGACGAIEAWLTIEMMRESWLAPTLNLETVDPRCAPLDYVRSPGRDAPVPFAMSNNFAFGGINTSLIFRRWSGNRALLRRLCDTLLLLYDPDAGVAGILPRAFPISMGSTAPPRLCTRCPSPPAKPS